MSELAELYLGLGFYSQATRQWVPQVAAGFVRRTGVSEVEKIQLLHVIRFKEACEREVQPVTYNGMLKYLRKMGDVAVKHGVMGENVFRQVALAKVGRLPRKDIARAVVQEVDRELLAHPRRYDPVFFWHTILWTLYYTGMRRRQIASLRRCDVDFVHNEITLRYASSKTRREWRVPIHPNLVEILEAYLAELVTRRVELQPDDALFPAAKLNRRYGETPDGFMHSEAVTHFFNRLKRRTGLTIGAQRLRHTFATTLCNPPEGSPDIFAVQELLGHTNLQTTRGYVRTQSSRLVAAIDILG